MLPFYLFLAILSSFTANIKIILMWRRDETCTVDVEGTKRHRFVDILSQKAEELKI